ncbi:MAG: PD40 domain-containing protein [Anaerolineae bacterium]|nr:PD40 domain-containing protein [Anaerolineae bacterium]
MTYPSLYDTHCNPESALSPSRSRHAAPRRRRLTLLAVLVLLVALAALPASANPVGLTTRVSIASDATQGDGASFGPAVSANGRYVTFGSEAGNLVPNDTNPYADIFVYDRQTFSLERVSVALGGGSPDAAVEGPAISADGRFVAFYSAASNLVANDTNGTWDVFVRDRQQGITTRVSIASDGTQANGPSAGGRAGGRVALAADGRYVAFASAASNLVANDTNTVWDVFVHDRLTGITTRVSVGTGGAQANADSGSPSLSANGQLVAFQSLASNLVANDLNGVQDVFVRDLTIGATTRVSLASDGTEGDGASGQATLAGGGQWVAFASDASNLVPLDTNNAPDVFLRDLVGGLTSRVSISDDGLEGNGASYEPAIASDGRLVAFTSEASNLVALDTNGFADVFWRDRQLGITVRASIASEGTEGDAPSGGSSVSADGRFIGFDSFARTLVAGDTNACGFYQAGHCPDVFVRERTASQGERIQGTVRLQSRAAHDGITLLLTGPTTTSTMTDSNGSFSFSNILPGEYQLTAQRQGWLCSRLPIAVGVGQTLSVPAALLLGGDIDGNGTVNIFDLVFVAGTYGLPASAEPRADLNGDGEIGLSDLVLVGYNFGSDCPQPWGTPAAETKASLTGKRPATGPRLTLMPGATRPDGLTSVEVWAEGLTDVHGLNLVIRTQAGRTALIGVNPFALDPALTDQLFLVPTKNEGTVLPLAGVVLGRQGLTGRVHLGTLTVRGDPTGLSIGQAVWLGADGQLLK